MAAAWLDTELVKLQAAAGAWWSQGVPGRVTRRLLGGRSLSCRLRDTLLAMKQARQLQDVDLRQSLMSQCVVVGCALAYTFPSNASRTPGGSYRECGKEIGAFASRSRIVATTGAAASSHLQFETGGVAQNGGPQTVDREPLFVCSVAARWSHMLRPSYCMCYV